MPALKYTSRKWMLFVCIGIVAGCNKSFVETDPATGISPVSLTTTSTGSCSVINISQKNRDYGNVDNSFQITRDTNFIPTRMRLYDSLAGKSDYDINVFLSGDSMLLSTGEYLLRDPVTKLIKVLSTKSDIYDPNSDDKLCLYFYNTQGYLIKKQIFLNGSSYPSYETTYGYDNNLLTGCVVTAGANKLKLIESTLAYDTSKIVKPWIYLFPDFFEGYNYLQAFNFGKKAASPVSSILTRIFDINDGSIIDYWYTSFAGYVYSKDNFILQTTAKGDLQQGLGLLFGITRFDYQCTK